MGPGPGWSRAPAWRHVGHRKDCAAALAEGEANEARLRNLDADDELAELRQRIAHATRAPAHAGFTAGRSEG